MKYIMHLDVNVLINLLDFQMYSFLVLEGSCLIPRIRKKPLGTLHHRLLTELRIYQLIATPEYPEEILAWNAELTPNTAEWSRPCGQSRRRHPSAVSRPPEEKDYKPSPRVYRALADHRATEWIEGRQRQGNRIRYSEAGIRRLAFNMRSWKLF